MSLLTSAIRSSSPYFYWPMDRPDNRALDDGLGVGRNLTLAAGSPDYGRPMSGRHRGAYFDTSDHATTPSLTLSSSSGFSIFAMVRPQAWNTAAAPNYEINDILNQWTGTNNQDWDFRFTGQGFLDLTLYTDSTFQSATSSVGLPLLKTSTVAGVVYSITDIRVFVNGATTGQKTTATGSFSRTGSPTFGRFSFDGSRYLDATVSHLTLWTRPVSPHFIARLHRLAMSNGIEP